jgi:hypothetical protein
MEPHNRRPKIHEKMCMGWKQHWSLGPDSSLVPEQTSRLTVSSKTALALTRVYARSYVYLTLQTGVGADYPMQSLVRISPPYSCESEEAIKWRPITCGHKLNYRYIKKQMVVFETLVRTSATRCKVPEGIFNWYRRGSNQKVMFFDH